MLGLSPIHIMALTAVALLVFGRKDKISSFMADLGGGIRNLRKGLTEPDPDEEHIRLTDEREKR